VGRLAGAAVSDDGAIEVRYAPAFMPDPGLKPKRPTGGIANIKPASPEWVETTYFYVWMDHDRPFPTKLLRLAEEHWQAYAPDTEFYPVSMHTLKDWMRKHQWAEKATRIIAENYPKDTRRQNARLVAMTDVYQDLESRFVSALMGEDPDMLKLPAHAWNAGVALIKEHRIARGLGTYHSALRTAPAIKGGSEAGANFAAMSLQELGRHVRALGADSKTDDDRRQR
jgi:hypothetical protein